MLYKKSDSILSINDNNKFGYEYTKYIIINRNTIALEDSKFLESNEYVKDKINANEYYSESIQLISAPKEWLINNNYEEVEDNYGIKKKFIKK